MTCPETKITAVDGRRARRARGRLAVIDAMVDLIQEEQAPPTAQAIAERAGVSISSLFRYFDNLDELREQSTIRFFERYASFFEIPDIGVGPFDERVGRYVVARITLYETIAPVSRLVRARSLDHPDLARTLSRVRHRMADQCRAHFAPELEPMTPAAQDDVVALLSALTSFEAWDLLQDELGRTPRQVQRSWLHAVRTLLHGG